VVLFNYSTKELTAKIVYYGAGLCGKTTNLQWVHEKLPIKNKGKMLSLATETDRTLFFDFLPIELGTIRGMKTRVQLYTVPGQVFYNATRRMVLKGADCVVFVCDSQEAMLDANLESIENLRQNLEANEIDTNEIPVILQYNKRDLPNALPIEIMNERLNPRGMPFFEAVALKGVGVEETLKGATALVFRSLAARYGGPGTTGASKEGAGGPGTKPPLRAPGGTGPIPRPATPPAAAPVATPVPPPRVVPSEQAPAHVRPPVAATATLPPTLGADEDLLDSLELQPESDEEELSLEVEESEVLQNTNPTPRGRVGHDTVAKSGPETDELRERLRQPPSRVQFEPIEEDVEISFDSPEPAPLRRPEPPPRPQPPAPRTPPPVARAPETPRPSPPTRPPQPSAPVEVATTVPVSVEVKPGIPVEAEVAIPVTVVIGGRMTQVQINLRLILDLKLPKP
jgi:signal recognition particle receptor subunit beta